MMQLSSVSVPFSSHSVGSQLQQRRPLVAASVVPASSVRFGEGKFGWVKKIAVWVVYFPLMLGGLVYIGKCSYDQSVISDANRALAEKVEKKRLEQNRIAPPPSQIQENRLKRLEEKNYPNPTYSYVKQLINNRQFKTEGWTTKEQANDVIKKYYQVIGLPKNTSYQEQYKQFHGVNQHLLTTSSTKSDGGISIQPQYIGSYPPGSILNLYSEWRGY